MQPIILYSRPLSPNPTKVLIILEELGLPYKTKFIPNEETRSPEYEAVCINGRVPSIYDPNTDLTLWESCAILEYLEAEYDTAKRLSYTSGAEQHLQRQWLYFQASGQGPYYGQMAWFIHLHHEKLPSAQTRYIDEMRRIMGVLDRHLAGRAWLVGDKCTVADLAFFPWNDLMDMALPEHGGAEFAMRGLENVQRWHAAMAERPSVKKARQVRALQDVESPGVTS